MPKNLRRLACALSAATMLALLPRGMAAQAHAPHGRVSGSVVDAASGAPVFAAGMWVDAGKLLAVSDSAGSFTLARTPARGDTLVVYRIGYDTLRVAAEALDTARTLRLTPDPVVLAGLRVLGNAEGTMRRERVICRFLIADPLRLSTGDALALAELRLGYHRVPCPSPPAGRAKPPYCSRIRGESEVIALYVDGARMAGGLDDLALVPVADIYSMEALHARRVVSVYTNEGAEAIARAFVRDRSAQRQ